MRSTLRACTRTEPYIASSPPPTHPGKNHLSRVSVRVPAAGCQEMQSGRVRAERALTGRYGRTDGADVRMARLRQNGQVLQVCIGVQVPERWAHGNGAVH